jgi:hypothetical protein
MENGGGGAPGVPAPTFELGFDEWPPREAKPTAFYLAENGALVRKRPKGGGIDEYRPDPAARPQQTIPGQGQSESWEILPDYDWRPLVDGTAVAYVTQPLAGDTTIVGPSSVEVALRSSAPDTDIQVTLSEVRPDGQEMYVQSGWLRASHRKLDRKRSSKLAPVHTHLERDARPLPAGEFTKLKIGVFAVAHVFRAGSRMRLSFEAPGGDRTRWSFDTPATGGSVLNEIAYGGGAASRVLLPVVAGVAAPPALPPCPSLRGQPCRAYVPAANGG